MLVHVVMLRQEGRRLTADEVRGAEVHTGRIQVTREPGGKLGSWARAAHLEVGQDQHLTLHRVQITSWDARGIVLMGLERHWSRRNAAEYPQSWWCRPVAASGSQAAAADPVDAEEEREQLMEAARLAPEMPRAAGGAAAGQGRHAPAMRTGLARLRLIFASRPAMRAARLRNRPPKRAPR